MLPAHIHQKQNCMYSLVNEPTKYLMPDDGRNGVIDLIWLTNIAHDQLRGRFELGSGNMEFIPAYILGDWIRFLCRDGNFEWLLLHIQGSCQTEEDTKYWCDYGKSLADQYGKKVSCSEANMFDIATKSGYDKLMMQARHAQRIKCKHFLPVFIEFDSSVVDFNTDSWKKLCFVYNGIDRSNGNSGRIEIAHNFKLLLAGNQNYTF